MSIILSAMNSSPIAQAWPRSERAQQYTFLAIVLIGFLCRVFLIVSTTYLWDEDREWIPLGRSISFGDETYLPWRSVSHPALAAYLIKLTSALIGDHPLGYRIGFAIAGALTIWAVGKLAWEWLGFRGGVIAAIVMTFNEYHLAISGLAMEKSPYLLFSALAVLQFGRFLLRDNARHLMLAAVFAGVAYLFKELAGLLLPVFFLTLLASGRAAWLMRRETFIAAGLGLLVVLPDIIWNIVHWQRGVGLHTSRIIGVGPNPHFLLFFARDAIRDIHDLLGRRFFDPVDEYPAMNVVWGAILLGSAAMACLHWRKLAPVGRLGAILFWFVLLFFGLTKAGTSQWVDETRTMIDSKVWFWVDQVLIGGALLTAWLLTNLTTFRRWLLFGALAIAAGTAITQLVVWKLGIPVASISFSPRTIWPPDGRLETVKAQLHACQICDPRIRLVEVLVDRNDRHGPVGGTATEVLDVSLGTDDREFRVRAIPGVDPERLDYYFHYAVTDRSAPESVISNKVTIMDRQLPLPFWLRQGEVVP